MKENAIKEWSVTLIIAAITLFVFKVIILLGVVPSTSMEPTIHKGSIAIVNGTAYWFSKPQRGDIIVFHTEQTEEPILIKRVIGLPGEKIVFKDNNIYIDGKTLEEEYIENDVMTFSYREEFTVPDNCYFMMGDNREDSYDSRYWKDPYVPKKDIKGKYLIQIPFGKFFHIS